MRKIRVSLKASIVLMASLACVARGEAVPGCGRAALRQSYAPPVFLGYLCRDPGCIAHKAGFAWAERQGIANPDACQSAADRPAIEGCRAYVEETITSEQAGFEWARENEIDDGCRCGGAGPRFEAGCEAYVTGIRG